MLKSLLLSTIIAVQVTADWIPFGWGPQSSPSPNNDNNSYGDDNGDLDEYARAMLDMHNQDRANHGVPNLVYNNTAAASAGAWASNCYYAHSHDGYGQNIAFFTTTNSGFSVIDAAERAMDGWYDGEIDNYINQYGAGSPQGLNIDAYAHFTQIVWAGTTSVGCATQRCGRMGNTGYSSGSGWSSYFTVCDYWPPGNWDGEYGRNVFPPLRSYKS